MKQDIVTDRPRKGVATLTLHRPQSHNAFDSEMLQALERALTACQNDTSIRLLVLTGSGKSFCAGADLRWMKRMSQFTERENEEDALRMAKVFRKLASFDKPTIARVQGAAFGGGVGLLAACDLAVAVDTAQFSLSEVRLGLVPAVISPYIYRAMGWRAANRYCLTGERFSAHQALDLGLLHEVEKAENLDQKTNELCQHLLRNGPVAMSVVKNRLRACNHEDAEIIDARNAKLIARLRVSPEGAEGIASFLEKRIPAWQED